MAHPGSGFRGDAFLGDLTPSPLTTQIIILVLFYDIYFRPINPINFIMAPLAPICTNFEGERAPKKITIFWTKFSNKCPKTAFLTCFVLSLPVAQKKMSK